MWQLCIGLVALVFASSAGQPVHSEEDACSVLQTHGKPISETSRDEILNAALLQSERALAFQRQAEQRAQAELRVLRAQNELLTRDLAKASAGSTPPSGIEANATGLADRGRNVENATDTHGKGNTSKSLPSDGEKKESFQTFHAAHGFFSRPEIKIAVKLSLISMGIALAAGLIAYLLGWVDVHPNASKYASWEELSEAQEKTGFGILNLPFHIVDSLVHIFTVISQFSVRTWRNIGVMCFFFGMGFYVMWANNIIQPVLQRLACYAYVFTFAICLVFVLLLELWYQVRHHIDVPINALHRVHQRIVDLEYSLGYVSKEDRDQLKEGTHPDLQHSKTIPVMPSLLATRPAIPSALQAGGT